MTRRSRFVEFYGKLCIAALLVICGCATAPKPAPVVTTIYLVRHGEKSLAVANDPDPVLTPAGKARAEALAERIVGSDAPMLVRERYGAPDPAPDSACVAMRAK